MQVEAKSGGPGRHGWPWSTQVALVDTGGPGRHERENKRPRQRAEGRYVEHPISARQKSLRSATGEQPIDVQRERYQRSVLEEEQSDLDFLVVVSQIGCEHPHPVFTGTVCEPRRSDFAPVQAFPFAKTNQEQLLHNSPTQQDLTSFTC
jgi:hypothetical protein